MNAPRPSYLSLTVHYCLKKEEKAACFLRCIILLQTGNQGIGFAVMILVCLFAFASLEIHSIAEVDISVRNLPQAKAPRHGPHLQENKVGRRWMNIILGELFHFSFQEGSTVTNSPSCENYLARRKLTDTESFFPIC